MTKLIIVSLLILLSSAASIYYSIDGVMHPASALVYNKAHMSRTGIQLLSLLLGVGGALILLPQTFGLQQLSVAWITRTVVGSRSA